MDFTLNEEQKMVKTNVREFMEKEVAPVADKRDREGPLTREEIISWRKKLEPVLPYNVEGLTGVMGGGEGVDVIAFAITVEEHFGAWAGLAGAVGMASMSMMALVSPKKMREKILPRLNAGELIGCIAISEPNAGSDNRAMQTKAVLDGDCYVINGTKTWITDGPVSDFCVLFAKDETGERQMFLVDREESPYQSSDLPKVGWHACPTGELYFDNCRVPKENNVMAIINEMMSTGKVDELVRDLGVSLETLPMETMGSLMNLLGLGPLTLALAAMRFGMALGGVGVSQRATDASINYAKERVQFDRPIGKFQLVQNMIVEMLTLTEAMRFFAYRAVDTLSRGAPETRLHTSMAKAFNCENALRVATLGVKVHGGMGLSQELPMERYFRDAVMLTVPDGTNEINRLVAGREILGISAYV